MSYVTPNSTLQLFKGINLDNRYLDTIYFANETAQDTWFTTKVFKTFNNLMYRRYQDNVVRIQADATELLGTTYMRFKNTRTASKWFYAFVLGVDYVNENTTDVYYEIDVMQTWFMQGGSIRPCMVLREHTNNDRIFSNLESEPVGSDAYEYKLITDADTVKTPLGIPHSGTFSDYSVVITTTGESSTGKYKAGLFDGTQHRTVSCNDSTGADNVATALNGYLGSWDAGEQQQEVLSLITFPSYFADASYAVDVGYSSVEVEGSNIIGDYNGEHYVPKNYKLFTYPYNYLYCTTHNGSNGIYKWEYFDNGDAYNRMTNKIFKIAGSSVGAGQIKCFPTEYAGIENNFEQGVSMTDFPRNAFNYDAYQAWIASGGKTRLENDAEITRMRNIATSISTGTQFATGMVSGIVNTGLGAVEMSENSNIASFNRMMNGINQMGQSTAGLISGVASIQEAQNKIDYQWKDASYRPNIPVGVSEPNLMVGGRALNFYFYNVYVKISEIVRIDDFFSTYGYATNKVKQPNLTGRRYWNFVQTQGAIIAGDMPSSSKEAIGRIFDGGITFWHDGDQVGNYAQSVSEGSINNPII